MKKYLYYSKIQYSKQIVNYIQIQLVKHQNYIKVFGKDRVTVSGKRADIVNTKQCIPFEETIINLII